MSDLSPMHAAAQEELADVLGPEEDDRGEMDAAFGDRPLRRWLLRGAIGAAVIGLGAVGFAMLSRGASESNLGQILTHPVERGDLLVTVTEDGTVESADNVQIKCEISGGTTILWLIEDGVEVEKGTLLAKLDSSSLDENVSEQQIAVEKARASYVQAEKDFNVAKIAIREYLEGTYKQELQTLEANITIARKS